ncbi:MAG: T9SS type A sorting domain-containing protein, partial [Ekhidna sp.]
NEIINYSFVDHSFLQTSYYRLLQIDFDGKSELSSTIMIVNNNRAEFAIYPNPFTNEINIDFSSSNFQLLVYNLSGRKVFEKVVSTKEASLLLEKLSVGTYQIQAFNEHFHHSQKLVKR